MAKFAGQDVELSANHLEGSLTAAGNGDWFSFSGKANLFITGAFVATSHLESSFDGGVTAVPVTLTDGTLRTFTQPDRILIEEVERGMLYRVVCTSRTSGTVGYRFSQ